MNMRSYRDLTRLITLILLLGLVYSCAKPQVIKPPEGSFFVKPEITYLRESPGDGSNALGSLYRGDKVEIVDAGESAWWRVELRRSGQRGWVRKELLSPYPIASVFYYVKEDNLPLLECPRHDCLPLQQLSRGDQVQRVEEGAQGWRRVLVVKNGSFGWVPAFALTERIEDTQQKQIRRSYYYVAVGKLILRAKPSNHAQVIRTLRFNDQVQKIGETKDWFQVRQPSTGALGWVTSRDLETFLLIAPRGAPSKDNPKPFKQKEGPIVEPEFM